MGYLNDYIHIVYPCVCKNWLQWGIPPKSTFLVAHDDEPVDSGVPNQSAVPGAYSLWNGDGFVKPFPWPGWIRHVNDGVVADSWTPSGSTTSEPDKDRKDQQVQRGMDLRDREPGFTGYRGYCGHPGPVPVGRLGVPEAAQASASGDPHHSNQQQTAQRNDSNEPCLFHSYAGCLKGRFCEYSHLIHADKVRRRDQNCCSLSYRNYFQGYPPGETTVHIKSALPWGIQD